jgi:hypothetical protein
MDKYNIIEQDTPTGRACTVTWHLHGDLARVSVPVIRVSSYLASVILSQYLAYQI